MSLGMMMVGCGEQAQKEAVEGESDEKNAQVEAKDDWKIPMAIPCEVCEKKVSKRSTSCPNCGHPTPASVVAYKEAQELGRIRAERERERQMEESKAQAKYIGLDDHTIILNAVRLGNSGFKYTGWGKDTFSNGQIRELTQLKDGVLEGLSIHWYKNGKKMMETRYKNSILMSALAWKPNGEKCPVTNLKDGNGVQVWYSDDGTEDFCYTYKDGLLVLD